MKAFHCEFLGLTTEFEGQRARVNMFEDHNEFGGRKGEVTITSQVRFIDFERKVLLTQNNMYYWK